LAPVKSTGNAGARHIQNSQVRDGLWHPPKSGDAPVVTSQIAQSLAIILNHFVINSRGKCEQIIDNHFCILYHRSVSMLQASASPATL
jgi:hypothetical protein